MPPPGANNRHLWTHTNNRNSRAFASIEPRQLGSRQGNTTQHNTTQPTNQPPFEMGHDFRSDRHSLEFFLWSHQEKALASILHGVRICFCFFTPPFESHGLECRDSTQQGRFSLFCERAKRLMPEIVDASGEEEEFTVQDGAGDRRHCIW